MTRWDDEETGAGPGRVVGIGSPTSATRPKPVRSSRSPHAVSPFRTSDGPFDPPDDPFALAVAGRARASEADEVVPPGDLGEVVPPGDLSAAAPSPPSG